MKAKRSRIVIVLSLLWTCGSLVNAAYAAGEEANLADGAVLRIFGSAGHRKDPAALYRLGNMFDEGSGVPQDHEEAFRWYYRASELGSADAMNCMGIAYATGQGTPQSYALSLRWFFKAAKYGSVEAMSNLAKVYLQGLGMSASYSEAARWFELAVRAGDASAMNNLALMYEKGIGVTRDHAVALTLLAQSAKRGHAPAMLNLGTLYANGESKRDTLLAFAWLEAALEAGLQGEEKRIASYRLGAVAARLDPTDLMRARRLVGEISTAVTPPHPPSRRAHSGRFAVKPAMS